MELRFQVISEFQNPLLERRQIWIRLDFNGPTPSRDQLRDHLCKFLNSDPKLTVVDKIQTEYGTSQAKIYLKIYEDPQVMLRVERPQILLRNKLIQRK